MYYKMDFKENFKHHNIGDVKTPKLIVSLNDDRLTKYYRAELSRMHLYIDYITCPTCGRGNSDYISECWKKYINFIRAQMSLRNLRW